MQYTAIKTGPSQSHMPNESRKRGTGVGIDDALGVTLDADKKVSFDAMAEVVADCES